MGEGAGGFAMTWHAGGDHGWSGVSTALRASRRSSRPPYTGHAHPPTRPALAHLPRGEPLCEEGAGADERRETDRRHRAAAAAVVGRGVFARPRRRLARGAVLARQCRIDLPAGCANGRCQPTHGFSLHGGLNELQVSPLLSILLRENSDPEMCHIHRPFPEHCPTQADTSAWSFKKGLGRRWK